MAISINSVRVALPLLNLSGK